MDYEILSPLFDDARAYVNLNERKLRRLYNGDFIAADSSGIIDSDTERNKLLNRLAYDSRFTDRTLIGTLDEILGAKKR